MQTFENLEVERVREIAGIVVRISRINIHVAGREGMRNETSDKSEFVLLAGLGRHAMAGGAAGLDGLLVWIK